MPVPAHRGRPFALGLAAAAPSEAQPSVADRAPVTSVEGIIEYQLDTVKLTIVKGGAFAGTRTPTG